MPHIPNSPTDSASGASSLHPALRGLRAVLFDVGGTLTHPDWPRLSLLAREGSGGEFAPEELARAFRDCVGEVDAALRLGEPTPIDTTRRHWTFRRMYTALGIDGDATERLCAQIDGAHAERHLWCGVDEDAARVLAALRAAGLRTAAVSNTEDGRLAELMKLVGLDSHFELMIDSFVVGTRKPDAAIFQLALRGLGVEAREAAFVGDSYAHDALAATGAGLRAVLIDPADLHPEAACPRIRSLAELIGEQTAA